MSTENANNRFAEHRPHRGNFGVCAPQSVAGDERALVTRPYATIAFTMGYAAGVFTPNRTNSSTGSNAAYVVGNAGVGDAGTDQGIADTLSRRETSFYSEGYPFRDYDFALKAVAIVPDGKPVQPGGVSGITATPWTGSKGEVSLGGDKLAAAGVVRILDGLSTALADSVVNLFFQIMSLKLGFKSESADWILGTPIMLPGGFGLDGGSVPNNGMPAGGRVMPLPFEVRLPRSTGRAVSNGMVMIRRELTQTIRVDAASVAVGQLAVLADASADPALLTQAFKVFLVGDRICPEEGDQTAALAAQYGCTPQQIEAMRKDGLVTK